VSLGSGFLLNSSTDGSLTLLKWDDIDDDLVFAGHGGNQQSQRAVRPRVLRVTIMAFIPEEWTFLPYGGTAVTDTIYLGDNRGFDQSSDSFRARQRFHVDRYGLWENATRLQWVDPLAVNQTRPSVSFEASTSLEPFEGLMSLDPSSQHLTAAAKADRTSGRPMMIETGLAAPGDMHVVASRLSENVMRLHCYGNANNPLASFGPINDISWDYNLDIDWSDEANVKVMLVGDHDAFPNYEVYVNEQPLHRYEHGAYTPLSLGPTMEIHVAMGPLEVP
jgi:hypothetical protein